jgi:hypothetical protein
VAFPPVFLQPSVRQPQKAGGCRGRMPGVTRLALLVLASLEVSTAFAVAAPPSPELKEKCGAEMRTLCLRPWRMTPDSISDCVSEDRSQLSPICQGFWTFAYACQLEMKSVCGGLSPFTIKQCLANSGDQFSAKCREFLDLK